MKNGAFTPEWLQRRLAALVPGYPDVSLCVALSGGVDSVVLLSALAAKLKLRGRRLPKVRAVHVHHGLHANADRWSEHCSVLAAGLEVPLTILQVKVTRSKGESLEATARDARYAALANALAAGEILLTAHHEDDQLETVFLQLMRGAGIAGLAAMPDLAPFSRGMLARPLLTRTRKELEAWARANDLAWIDDDTNEDEQLDRNYLRRQVLPLIHARWPSASRAVSRSARHAAEAKRLLDALGLADVERAASGDALSVQQLRALTPDRRRNAVRFWIARAGHTLPDTTRLDEITRTLLDARPDANPSVEWNTTRVQRHADQLSIKGRALSIATVAQTEGVAWNWRVHSHVALAAGLGALSISADAHGPLDLDALPETLTIRQRVGGERLKKGGRTKTLKSLLQEARLPPAERTHLPLLFAGDRLIAVANCWLDDSVLAASGARHRGRIRWRRT